MLKNTQKDILEKCCALIDQRLGGCPEPGAKQFAVTWLEGAVSAATLIGKHDLAESMAQMLGSLQEAISWAAFRQKIKR